MSAQFKAFTLQLGLCLKHQHGCFQPLVLKVCFYEVLNVLTSAETVFILPVVKLGREQCGFLLQ